MKSDGLWVFQTGWWKFLSLLGKIGGTITVLLLFVYDLLLSYQVIPFNHPLEGVITWVGGITMGVWVLMFLLFFIIDFNASRE